MEGARQPKSLTVGSGDGGGGGGGGSAAADDAGAENLVSSSDDDDSYDQEYGDPNEAADESRIDSELLSKLAGGSQEAATDIGSEMLSKCADRSTAYNTTEQQQQPDDDDLDGSFVLTPPPPAATICGCSAILWSICN